MIKGILNKKKRKFKDGTTFAEVQKQWRLQQRNGKLTKDSRLANRQSWKEYLKFHSKISGLV